MNTKFITSFTVVILIISSIIGCTETQKPVQLELRSSPWNFTTQDTPLNTLTQQNTKITLYHREIVVVSLLNYRST